MFRAIGIDVHRDFCVVAIAQAGRVRVVGGSKRRRRRWSCSPRAWGPSGRVALEITGNAGEIARILAPRVASVQVVSPNDTGISRARAKTDRLDARTLAKLLAAGELDAVWMPDEWTRAMRRRLSRRSQLVRSRTRAKNEIHAALIRRLQGRPPVSDLFGARGRAWLAELVLPETSARRSRVACDTSTSSMSRSASSIARSRARRCATRTCCG